MVGTQRKSETLLIWEERKMKKSVLVAMMMVLAAVVGILAVCEAASASMGMGLFPFLADQTEHLFEKVLVL